jgi:predicted CoA-substrate-specific enzyme activase
MAPLLVGIDVGSAAMKVVAVREGQPVFRLEEPTQTNVAAQAAAALEHAREACTAGKERVCATGYGRNLVADADRQVSEIIANAAGVGWLQRNWSALGGFFGDEPQPPHLDRPVRTVIDVGGQDSKVIVFDDDGFVRDFAMNDRCAAGTGRFLEVMAGVLEVDIARLDEMARAADEPADITSACTVFAESEVVSLISEGVAPERIAAGVYHSIAGQVAALAARCGWRPAVLFDGGTSRSLALRQALAEHLGTEPVVPPQGQFATAIGAALLAEGETATGLL